MDLRTVIFHGPSGSGKDTQLDLLAKEIGFVRIGSSDVMRDLRSEGHELAKTADEYGKQGKLYPDEIIYGMLDIWSERLDPNSRWFFISPVRKKTQIELFDDLVSKHWRKIDLFVHFELSEESAIERLSNRRYCPECSSTYHKIYKREEKEGFCNKDGQELVQRDDDKPEAIKNRLEWYNDDIEPILKEYDKRGVLLNVDASPSIEEIHKKLVNELKRYG